MDSRPLNCRFRLQEEGRAYPKSSCEACGKTVTTGLGRSCTKGHREDMVQTMPEWRSAAGYLSDVMSRTAHALTEEKIPPNRIAQYLRDLADDVLDAKTH